MEFENEDTKYKIFVAILLFFLIVFGIFVGLSISYNTSVSNDLSSYTPNEMKEDLENMYENNTEAVITKTYDIELVYIDNYTLCNEKIERSDTIFSTTLDELKKQEKLKQQKDKNEYKIKEESNERLVYERTLNQNCPNHFFIVIEEQKINVYNILTNEIKEFYQTIDISEALIRKELVEELTKGITANSKEELNLIIEDIES